MMQQTNMETKKTISLIVPCKNEAKILPGFMKKVPSYVSEVLIVDNNSTDTTREVATELGATVLTEPRKKNGIGYGYAHMTGIQAAKGDYLVAMDGDDTYPLNSIAPIIRYMERHNLDFVSCNRLPLKNKKAISKIRQLGIHILNAEVRLLYGYPIQDILTGMWIVKKEAAEKLQLTQGDWNLSPEIKLAALHHPKIRFGEYHIRHFERVNEISKQKLFNTGLSHLLYIAKRRLTVDNDIIAYFKGIIRYGSTIRTRLAENYSA